jgi:hypothetical protein
MLQRLIGQTTTTVQRFESNINTMRMHLERRNVVAVVVEFDLSSELMNTNIGGME